MNIPIKNKIDVAVPPKGYVFPFIDQNDMQLKAKLSDGLIINYSNVDSELKTLSLTDYTAFEVYANDKTISAGTIDEVSGLTYENEVPAGMNHWVILRSETNSSDSDVVVEWGDGSYSYAKELTSDDVLVGTTIFTYRFQHTYATSGRYVVKVYGKDYFGFNKQFKAAGDYDDHNLICRVLDKDLPVASHITNLASMAALSKRLLIVRASAYRLTNTYNWANLFIKCPNLKYVYGMYAPEALYAYKSMFTDCTSLIETDFTFPRYSGDSSFYTVFSGCVNLTMDIADLIPVQGFISHEINVSAMCKNCAKLYGTVPANVLWDDRRITWSNPVNAFRGCSAEIRKQVPKSWGGTADDSIIKPSAEERIANLEERIAKLEETSLMLE